VTASAVQRPSYWFLALASVHKDFVSFICAPGEGAIYSSPMQSQSIKSRMRLRAEMEHEKNVVEAVLINEKLRGKAPKGWDSTEVIRA